MTKLQCLCCTSLVAALAASAIAAGPRTPQLSDAYGVSADAALEDYLAAQSIMPTHEVGGGAIQPQASAGPLGPNCGSATVIPTGLYPDGMEWYAGGDPNTCVELFGLGDDLDAFCGFINQTAGFGWGDYDGLGPDAVFSYTVGANDVVVEIATCLDCGFNTSTTALYVFEGNCGNNANLVACEMPNCQPTGNDGAFGTQILGLVLRANTTYFIVADGVDEFSDLDFNLEFQAEEACDLVSTGRPEAETCGADSNNGCNEGLPTFATDSISCGETVAGTADASGWDPSSPDFSAPDPLKDYDWYRIELDPNDGAVELNVTVTSEFPTIFGIAGVDPLGAPILNAGECDAYLGTTQPNDVLRNGGCESGSVAPCLPVSPGASTFYIYVAPISGSYLTCGVNNAYELTVNCTPCTPCTGSIVCDPNEFVIEAELCDTNETPCFDPPTLQIPNLLLDTPVCATLSQTRDPNAPRQNDFDIWQVTIPQEGLLNISVTAEFNIIFGEMVQVTEGGSGCSAITATGTFFVTEAACGETGVDTRCLPAGTYQYAVSLGDDNFWLGGNCVDPISNYIIEATLTPPPGGSCACVVNCDPSDTVAEEACDGRDIGCISSVLPTQMGGFETITQNGETFCGTNGDVVNGQLDYDYDVFRLESAANSKVKHMTVEMDSEFGPELGSLIYIPFGDTSTCDNWSGFITLEPFPLCGNNAITDNEKLYVGPGQNGVAGGFDWFFRKELPTDGSCADGDTIDYQITFSWVELTCDVDLSTADVLEAEPCNETSDGTPNGSAASAEVLTLGPDNSVSVGGTLWGSYVPTQTGISGIAEFDFYRVDTPAGIDPNTPLTWSVEAEGPTYVAVFEGDIGADPATAVFLGETVSAPGACGVNEVIVDAQPSKRYYLQVFLADSSEPADINIRSGFPCGIDNNEYIGTVSLPGGGSGCLCGDVNNDGFVNALDIDCFVQAVVSGATCDADCSLEAADTNDDGFVNALDIDPFVAAVVGGACQ